MGIVVHLVFKKVTLLVFLEDMRLLPARTICSTIYKVKPSHKLISKACQNGIDRLFLLKHDGSYYSLLASVVYFKEMKRSCLLTLHAKKLKAVLSAVQ